MTAVRRYEVDEDDVATEIAESIYAYNANNAVASITHQKPNETQIVKHSYLYDSVNNIIEYLNSLDGQTSYDYDFLGQLVGADYANQSLADEAYAYDANGNRLTSVTQQEFDSETETWQTVQTVEYAYDYNNVWIRKIAGNSKTIFIPENYQTTVQIDDVLSVAETTA